MSHEQYSSVIESLHKCMEACNHCYDACLNEEDVKHMANCIRTDRECADMCGFLEQALVRNTPFAAELASVCAKICDACAEECSKHEHDHCQKCADACRECADACRQIA